MTFKSTSSDTNFGHQTRHKINEKYFFIILFMKLVRSVFFLFLNCCVWRLDCLYHEKKKKKKEQMLGMSRKAPCSEGN
jgi:hypothetical protein